MNEEFLLFLGRNFVSPFIALLWTLFVSLLPRNNLTAIQSFLLLLLIIAVYSWILCFFLLFPPSPLRRRSSSLFLPENDDSSEFETSDQSSLKRSPSLSFDWDTLLLSFPDYRRDLRFWSFLNCPLPFGRACTDLLFNLTIDGAVRDSRLQQSFDALFIPLISSALPFRIDPPLLHLSAHPIAPLERLLARGDVCGPRWIPELAIRIWGGSHFFRDYEAFAARRDAESDPLFWAFDLMVRPDRLASWNRLLGALESPFDAFLLAVKFWSHHADRGQAPVVGNQRIDAFVRFLEGFLACALVEGEAPTRGTREQRVQVLEALYDQFEDPRVMELIRRYSIRDDVCERRPCEMGERKLLLAMHSPDPGATFEWSASSVEAFIAARKWERALAVMSRVMIPAMALVGSGLPAHGPVDFYRWIVRIEREVGAAGKREDLLVARVLFSALARERVRWEEVGKVGRILGGEKKWGTAAARRMIARILLLPAVPVGMYECWKDVVEAPRDLMKIARLDRERELPSDPIWAVFE